MSQPERRWNRPSDDEIEQVERDLLRRMSMTDVRSQIPRLRNISARARLADRAENIDISKVGIVDRYIRDVALGDVEDRKSELLMSACVKYLVAQALLDGVSMAEEGLTVRELNPEWDFLAPFPTEVLPLGWHKLGSERNRITG